MNELPDHKRRGRNPFEASLRAAIAVWKARALKAEGELERWTLMPSVTVGGGQQVYGELDAISRVQDYILLDSTHPVEREDVRRSLARALQAAEAEISRLSASGGEVDGWRRPSREAIARIIDPAAHIDWGYALPPSVARREAALAKADAILSLPPLDEGKGKEASVASLRGDGALPIPSSTHRALDGEAQ